MRLLHGDCRERMRELPENSVDAIVTDPPYGLEFMGKEWDRLSDDPNTGKMLENGFGVANGKPDQRAQNAGGSWFGSRDGSTPNYHRTTNAKCRNCGRWRISGGHDGRGNTLGCKCEHPDFPNVKGDAAKQMQSWHESWAREAYRVLKPGGHLLAFGGSRTYHRLACAIEDAGFEIRDQLQWLYGSGFPKSLDVSRAIDKAAGAERERIGRKDELGVVHGLGKANQTKNEGWRRPWMDDPNAEAHYVTAPATNLAHRWQGFGTALKPAHEPIVLARKPLIGTVSRNVTEHGTGALNIDGCRIESGERPVMVRTPTVVAANAMSGESTGATSNGEVTTLGRWPANVILDEDAAALLDAQSGERKSGANPTRRGSAKFGTLYGDFEGQRECIPARGAESGGASRFFYTAKASRAERNAGLDGMPERNVNDGRQTSIDNPYQRGDTLRSNTHPTVKPISLMRWLCKLITPPGGTVLDPFMGSGTTGIAAALEGFDFIGVEQDAEYLEIARRRIAHWTPLLRDKPKGQLALFAQAAD